MKLFTLTLAGLVASLPAGAAAASRVPRTALQPLERAFDQRIQRTSIDDPFDLLGTTRGVYLEGFGVVFTTEVNLVTGPALTPFRPKFSVEELEKLRQRKLARVAQLKQLMREMVTASAGALGALGAQENIVVGVTLFYHPWELTQGLPLQIVMRAPSKAPAAIDEQVY